MGTIKFLLLFDRGRQTFIEPGFRLQASLLARRWFQWCMIVYIADLTQVTKLEKTELKLFASMSRSLNTLILSQRSLK